MHKHTIPQAIWYNFPSLSAAEYTTVPVVNIGGKYVVDVRIGKQGGHWVTGYYIKAGEGSAAAFTKSQEPSRKWGEYATYKAAIIATLEGLLSICYYHRLTYKVTDTDLTATIYAIQKRLELEKGKQLSLF